MIKLERFDSCVIECDLWRGAFANVGKAGVCRICKSSLGEPHMTRRGNECIVLRGRREGRIGLIARAWVHSIHPLMPSDEASVWHDAYSEWLETYPDLTAEELDAAAAELAPGLEDAMRQKNKYRHLDKGWDGKGWAPSSIAAIKECMEQ